MPAPDCAAVSFRRRAAAALLDGLLFVFLAAILRGLLLIGSGADAEQGRLLVQTLQVALFASIPALILLWWQLFQGTPGKLLLDCTLIDVRSGARPRFWQLLVRLLGYALSALPAGLGFLWVAWDKRGEAWHDKLSRTRVVSDNPACKSLQQLSMELR